MLVYGIDPGLTGALAVLINGRLIDVADLPVREEGGGTVKRRLDAAVLAAMVREVRRQHGVDSELAVIERVGAMPKQGVASVFSLGHTAGVVEATMLAIGVPVEFVSPAVWKRSMELGRDKSDARAKASLCYPEQAGFWRLKSQHNRAEAALLARYGWGEHA